MAKMMLRVLPMSMSMLMSMLSPSPAPRNRGPIYLSVWGPRLDPAVTP
jgi:hypothetical protein